MVCSWPSIAASPGASASGRCARRTPCWPPVRSSGRCCLPTTTGRALCWQARSAAICTAGRWRRAGAWCWRPTTMWPGARPLRPMMPGCRCWLWPIPAARSIPACWPRRRRVVCRCSWARGCALCAGARRCARSPWAQTAVRRAGTRPICWRPLGAGAVRWPCMRRALAPVFTTRSCTAWCLCRAPARRWALAPSPVCRAPGPV